VIAGGGTTPQLSVGHEHSPDKEGENDLPKEAVNVTHKDIAGAGFEPRE
jgi:hypothetical protein